MHKDGRLESMISHITIHRSGTPDDIGYSALYLASDQANYVTGTVHVPDAGCPAGFARDRQEKDYLYNPFAK